MLSVTLPTGSKDDAAGCCNCKGGCGWAGVNTCFVSDEPVSFDRFLTSITSVTTTVKNVHNMKKATKSTGSPAALLKANEPPSIIPRPQIAIKVMAVKNAVIGAVLFDSAFSFKLAPQRLQKLRLGVTGDPQFTQYIPEGPSCK